MLNVKVRDSTIKKTRNKCGLFGTFARRRPRLSKKNVAAQLRFAKLHLNNHRSSGTILWTDENNMEMFGHNTECYIWQKPVPANLYVVKKNGPKFLHNDVTDFKLLLLKAAPQAVES